MFAFLAPVFKLIAPYFSKIILYVLIAVVVIAGLWYLDPYRAKYSAAETQIAQDAATANALAIRNLNIQHQLTAEIASAQAQAAHFANIRKAISDAPHTTSCASSPAFRAALDGLRNETGSTSPPAD